jgi:3-oxoacyl-[acyl-carrier protein] reductase
VVTGANRGLGRAVAVAYAEAGYAVAVTAREPATCADTVAEIESRDGTAIALACDVTVLTAWRGWS